MHIIGLTGGIASGKSTVSKLLKEFGAYIIDADQIAREIVQPGQPALQEIEQAFGPGIILPDGSLDRKKVGGIVFKDEQALKRLNTITHNRIKLEIDKAIEKATREGYNVVVLDVPLLIEVGWQHMTDSVWVVYVDKETQIKRLLDRDNLSQEDALGRIAAQMALDEKILSADVIIDNRGSLEKTRIQIIEALSKLSD